MVGGKVAVGLALASPLVYLYSLYLPRYYTCIRASAYMYTCKGSFSGSSSSRRRRREETYISSLILLLKFLSLPSRHTIHNHNHYQLQPNSDPTSTNNQELHHHHHGWLWLHLKLWMRFERKLHLRKFFFFPYTINGTYLGTRDS